MAGQSAHYEWAADDYIISTSSWRDQSVRAGADAHEGPQTSARGGGGQRDGSVRAREGPSSRRWLGG